MDLRARLQLIADALPPSGSVVLTRADLVAMLEDGGSAKVRDKASAGLTVEEVGERIGRAPGTIREWIRSGLLEGKKLRGREYRVGEDALRKFLETEASGDRTSSRPRQKAANLGEWRQHTRKAG